MEFGLAEGRLEEQSQHKASRTETVFSWCTLVYSRSSILHRDRNGTVRSIHHDGDGLEGHSITFAVPLDTDRFNAGKKKMKAK